MRKIKLILTLLFVWNIVLYSQVSMYDFKIISPRKGLSQSTVYSIFQDSKGFLWFGTNDGLNRYDGKNMVLLTYKDGNKRKILKGSVRGLDESADQKLFIANYGVGLNVYNLNNDEFKTYHSNDSVDNSLSSDFVNSVLCVDEKTVWISTDKGVSKFNPLAETFRNYTLPVLRSENSAMQGAFSLFEDENHNLWIGSQGRGLFKFVAEEERFVPFVNKTKGGDFIRKNFISGIVSFKDGLFLVATKAGLFLFDPQTGVFFKYKLDDIELYKIAKDQFGGFWITSRLQGLYHIDKNEKLEQFNNNPYDLMSFPDYQLLSIYKDHMQNVWVGTQTHGVVQINLERKPFVNLYHVPNKPSISDNSVFALDEDEKGDVWIGTTRGLTIWNRENNSFKPVRLKLPGNKMVYDISVWSLFFDKRNVVWIGTNSGLIKYDRKTGRQTNYYAKTNKKINSHVLLNNDIICMEKDKKNSMWIATPGGVNRLNLKNNSIKHYTPDTSDNSLSHSMVWDILCDSKGRLWFCTENGLDIFDYKTDNFSKIKFSKDDFNPGNTLSNSTVSILESAEGDMWVTTRSGIFILDPDNKEIKGFVKSGGKMMKEQVYNILEADSSFWASTNKGLIKIDKASYGIDSRYTVDDGLLSNEYNAGSAKKLRDGYFLFGGINGATAFYPGKIHRSKYCPPVYYTGISLFGKDVSPENPEVWIRAEFVKNLTSASRIIFTPDEKMFSLKFTALDYVYPDNVSYFYRILPVSEKWIALGKRNFVSFINLNSGNYTLEVKSTNGDGFLCNNVRSIELVILPPFWKKWWVLLSGSILLGLLIFMIVRFRVLRLRREKKKLEEIVDVRTKEIQQQRNIANKQRDEIARQKEKLQDFASELEDKVRERTKELEHAKLKAEESDRLKSAFLSNMSHEIRTPMNAIIGFSELLLTTGFDESEREIFAKMVKSNGDALLSLLNDIIDISMIESGQLKLNFTDVDVCNLVNETFLIFKKSKLLSDKKDVKLKLSAEVNKKIIINTDSNRLRQIINNLLNNALKFTDKGVVELGCREENDKILFYVKDTGIGISEDFRDKIFERFYKHEKDKNSIYGGNGLGLTITRNLVEALKGKIWVESVEGKGTTFFFTFPK